MTTDRLLEEYDKITKKLNRERYLWHLLNENKEHIKGLIESDKSGVFFHKAFRQTSVCSNANIDIAIWHLLCEAKLFWEVLTQK